MAIDRQCRKWLVARQRELDDFACGIERRVLQRPFRMDRRISGRDQ
jgi:hypothetical protein